MGHPAIGENKGKGGRVQGREADSLATLGMEIQEQEKRQRQRQKQVPFEDDNQKGKNNGDG